MNPWDDYHLARIRDRIAGEASITADRESEAMIDAVSDRRYLLRLVDRLAAENALLKELLGKIEWVAGEHEDYTWCPSCGHPELDGHSEACALAFVLKSESTSS